MAAIEEKRMRALTIHLTDAQKKQIQEFWEATGSLGSMEIHTEVVNNRISPASIQVGTAK